MITKIFYDVETTGVNYKIHSMHQLAGLVEVDDEVVETFDFKLRPHPKAEITPEALKVCGVTEEELKAYPPAAIAHRGFKALLSRYVNKYDKSSKAYLVGFNNRFFDDQFLRKHFELQDDDFFGAWFWSDSLDVFVLASEYLIDRRPSMASFKLHRVAATLGLEVDKDKTHDAFYDVNLTRQIYRIVTGREIEL